MISLLIAPLLSPGPTELPAYSDNPFTDTKADVTAKATDAPKEDLTVFTGPPTTDQAAVPQEVTTDAVTEAPLPSTAVITEHHVETESPAPAFTAAPEPLTTDSPAVETAAPTDSAEVEVQTEAMGATEADMRDQVLVEEDTEGEECVGWRFG